MQTISCQASERAAWKFAFNINRMRGLYGKVLPEVFRTDQATKERDLCDENRRQFSPVQTKHANEVNKGFII